MTVIPLERRSPSASSGLPGDGAGRAIVPLHGLAPGSACPFHPAVRGFVTVALASPHGGGALPLTLPCGVRTFLGGFRRRDRLACSVLLFYRARHPLHELRTADGRGAEIDAAELGVELEQAVARLAVAEAPHVCRQARDVEQPASEMCATPLDDRDAALGDA